MRHQAATSRDAPRRNLQTRPGVTLVELLIVITIVGILASAVLFAMTTANESAKRAKTEAMIATLHGLLMERYDSYQTRRVPLIPETSANQFDRTYLARQRLAGVRRLMQLEMPDRWSEINLGNAPAANNSLIRPLATRPALSQAYQRVFDRLQQQNGGDWPDQDQYQLAECLFLTITMGTDDGQGREHFSDADIGDTDGDGAKEFLDGWGRPIRWLRWPAGYISPLQPDANGFPDDGRQVDAATDHDPFDPLRVDPQAFRVLPLVYSDGPDGRTDLAVGTSYNDPSQNDYPNPYRVLQGNQPGTQRVGSFLDGNPMGQDNSVDNITSHWIGAS